MLFTYRQRVIAAAVLGAFAIPASAADSTDASNGVTELSTVNVTAPTAAETVKNTTQGYVAKRAVSATKTDTPIDETPQTINVVTRKQMDDQAVQSVNEALRYTPGVSSFGTDNRSDWYTVIRGFQPTVYQDGMLLPYTKDYSSWSVDPYQLESIEVLRGPASVLYGQGDPGATVNLTSKLPTLEDKHEIQLQYGSNNRKQIGLDYGGKLNEDGSLYYRVVALTREGDLTTAKHKDRRQMLAPSITWQPSDDTKLTLKATYLHDNTASDTNFLPAEGTLLPNQNGKISSSLYTGDPYSDTYQRRQWTVGYNFEHRLNSTWTFRQNFNLAHLDSYQSNVYGSGLDSSDTTQSTLLLAQFQPHIVATQVHLDNQMQAKFTTGALEHTALFGLDYQKLRFSNKEWDVDNAGTLNLYNPVYSAINTSGRYLAKDKADHLADIGTYFQDQIKFSQRWIFVVGGRFDQTKYTEDDFKNATSQGNSDSKFTYRTGVVYKADHGISPFISYSTSFKPQLGTLSSTGELLKPTTGKQVELGVRYEPIGTQSSITASVYKILQDNVSVTNPVTQEDSQIGQVRSQGFEIQGMTSINKNLNITASYVYQDVKNTKGGNGTLDTTGLWITNTPTPRQMASIWGDYTFHGGVLDKFGVGAGVRYVSESAASYTYGDNSLTAPSYTLLDAALHYQLQKWRLALNVQNITNKHYVTGCSYSAACFYGNPRNITATATYSW